MKPKQLFALFVCNLVILSVGNGPFALLAVYVNRLGGDAATAGYLLSTSFVAITAGTVFAGWFSDRFQRRKLLLIVSGATQVPTLWLLGQATSVAELALPIVIGAFFVGASLSMSTTIVGLFAEEARRGQAFGILTSTFGLGAVIGGLAGGPIADAWGFPTLFTISAALSMLHPLTALLVEDKVVVREPYGAGVHLGRGALLSRAFVVVCAASIVAFLTNSVHILGKQLIMNEMAFDATAILSTVAVGGIITLPLPLLTGRLSDRIGRKPLLALCYGANFAALMLLAASTALWQFQLSTALQAVLVASIGVGAALVTDLVPPETLGVAVSLFGATNTVGFVIGFAATGASIQGLGMTPTLLLGAFFSLVAVALVLLIRREGATYAVATR